MPAPAPSANTPKQGRWVITHADSAGKERSAMHIGQLVLQEDWTLVLDPRNKGVIFAVPNVNVISVSPAT